MVEQTQSKNEPQVVEIPVFLSEQEVQKMVYLMFFQMLPRIETKLDDMLKLAKEVQ